MFRSHFGETVTVVLALVMGVIMAVAVSILDHVPFNYSNFFKLFSMITMVVLLVSIVIPYKAISAKFVALLPVKKGTLGYKLLDGIIPTLILNTVITVMVAGANILYNPEIPAQLQITEWLAAIAKDWPITLVISYLASFVAEAIGVAVAKRNHCAE